MSARPMVFEIAAPLRSAFRDVGLNMAVAVDKFDAAFRQFYRACPAEELFCSPSAFSTSPERRRPYCFSRQSWLLWHLQSGCLFAVLCYSGSSPPLPHAAVHHLQISDDARGGELARPSAARRRPIASAR